MKKEHSKKQLVSFISTKTGLALMLLCFCILSVQSQSVNKPTQTEVLSDMLKANAYFMNLWPDPTAPIVHTDRTRPSNLWTRGTYFEGLMQLFYITGDSTYYRYGVDWGTFHKWQPTYVGNNTTRIADNQCCGQTYLELYAIDPKPERIATMQRSIDEMVNSSRNNDWWWIDAIQMAMPVFAGYGKLHNDTRYYDKMYELYSFPRYQVKKGTGLYNPVDKLWYRDSVYLPPKTSPNGLPVYWSRGNGWVLAALARVLDIIPADEPHRGEYLTMFTDMASKLITIQREDGFWNVNLGDPNDFGGKETSGTAFFVYGLAWGINRGVLDPDIYTVAMLKGWNGMVDEALHPDGSLGWMQSTGSKPADGQPLSYTRMPNFEDYGLGAFLLAGSELYRYADDQISSTNTTESRTLLRAYPNPFSNELNISVEQREQTTQLSIYNLGGVEVYSRQLAAGPPELIRWNAVSAQGENLPDGLYFITLDNQLQRASGRFLLMR